MKPDCLTANSLFAHFIAPARSSNSRGVSVAADTASVVVMLAVDLLDGISWIGILVVVGKEKKKFENESPRTKMFTQKLWKLK